jgi:TetR/AcrR family transcriptional repressor of nem operon
MRYPKGHREETHARIVDEAARAFRENGIEGVSIGDLMARLGLTHGGFYAHFENKDVLAAEACERAATEGQELLYRGTERLSRDEALLTVIRRYLSRTHRDHPENGCAAAAMGSEMRRASPVVRSMFSRVVTAIATRFRAVLPEGATQDDALGMLATMVGGMVLARAVDDPALSDRILQAARRFAAEGASKKTR